MPKYIEDIELLSEYAADVFSATEDEIQAAVRVLSANPVDGEPEITEENIRLVSQYRLSFSLGNADPIWQEIWQGKPTAWVYAIHETAELQAFAEMNVNPFDIRERTIHLGEAISVQ